ncbi:30S ribosomal protein S16 [Candidatus Babela massiliensis]|mgnify:CR=1 FL=1|uniref:Small ribosomal subunit protein bS16 n=1 Tax=Candidatus Babela massiliensis TaxID=673862 RepID=V6DG42_9BACT|nr:30S ribosomal protein S16 [Candidatus Babela massiliensis]CDK30530.1 ribosomal protein S16 [Candidatus Babela massiliensis]
MAVKIRLTRVGKTNTPFYRIIAIDSRKKRDGAALDILGTYDPVEGKLIQFNPDRVQEWVSKGAIVSDAVKRLEKLYKKTAA